MATVYTAAFFDTKVVPLKEATVNITSSAVLYGLSVYSVFPVCVTQDGLAAFRLADHFTRLVNSARIIGIDTFEGAWTRERFGD
ncbi:branched-chain amino acid aminotransferase, partial [Candidatus Kaiserbacteria bacterium]|nr:branched-chain amino acid aminotransferase [Candidatus Kaiserbacteria bacterium]